LLSHTVLATASVPLIVWTIYCARRRDFIAHRKVAPIAFPIWLYVSMTGVLVYLMLYHLPLTFAASAMAP
jgi:uncharacterized membrane protein YozB (DUF420 family)